jgi:glutathione synthase
MAQGLSLLFIVDPLDDLKAYKDTSIAMMREAARRGHDVWACEAAALRWRDGKVRALCQLLDLLPGDMRPGTLCARTAATSSPSSTPC